MKKINRFSIVMALVLVVLFFYDLSYAEETVSINEIKRLEEQQELTPYIAQFLLDENTNSIKFYKNLNVPLYRQENGYYCGPATVKQTLQFINGSSLSQGTYAGSSYLDTKPAGTDFNKVLSVVNRLNSKHKYNLSTIYGSPSFSTWFTYIRGTLNKGVPAIIDINSNGHAAWGYSTSGHFLNISGADMNVELNREVNTDELEVLSTTSLIKITDPHRTYYRTRWMSANLVYQVNMAHFRSQIMY